MYLSGKYEQKQRYRQCVDVLLQDAQYPDVPQGHRRSQIVNQHDE